MDGVVAVLLQGVPREQIRVVGLLDLSVPPVAEFDPRDRREDQDRGECKRATWLLVIVCGHVATPLVRVALGCDQRRTAAAFVAPHLYERAPLHFAQRLVALIRGVPVLVLIRRHSLVWCGWTAAGICA
jgi:hypothetical protein